MQNKPSSWRQDRETAINPYEQCLPTCQRHTYHWTSEYPKLPEVNSSHIFDIYCDYPVKV